MKKTIMILIVLILTLSLASASALTVPLKGLGTDGSEKEITVPDDCRLILVDLWQPWCGYCIQGMPDTQAMYEKYRDQGLAVIGMYSYTDVNQYTNGMTAQEILDLLNITYPNLRITDEWMAGLAQSFPMAYLADREGNILPMTYDEKAAILAGYVREQTRIILESGDVPEDSEEYAMFSVMLESEEYQTAYAEILLENDFAYLTDTEGYIGAAPAAGWDRVIRDRLENTGAAAPAAAAEASESTGYTVTVTDEDGNPVPGVSVQICPGARCIVRKSGEDGKAYFADVEPGAHAFHLVKIPSGYETASGIPETTAPDTPDILITLRKAE